MRAKAIYAEALNNLGLKHKSIQQAEEILELNPNDNQGVRYTLFPTYMEEGLVEKAEELLNRYDEGGAHNAYNLLLIEITKNGFTPKATKLLKDAKKENKYVPALLTGKKRLPKQLPDYYGFGDENEAVIYADAHLHLWKKIKGLRNG